ncbi:tetratricopeptide repeat protein [Bibersteinia trehalosi]|uniref:tetratricopeptide repeat protein n=1 Tax=Bibersteinia trehalosi TaxID=47735 RepID=UPI003D2DC125
MYTVLAENDKQAVYWFKKAAEQGYAKAQFTLGRIYDNGKGVRRDVYKENSMGMLVIMAILVAVRAMQSSISKVFVNFSKVNKNPDSPRF